jgi:hypothetical protein
VAPDSCLQRKTIAVYRTKNGQMPVSSFECSTTNLLYNSRRHCELYMSKGPSLGKHKVQGASWHPIPSFEACFLTLGHVHWYHDTQSRTPWLPGRNTYVEWSISRYRSMSRYNVEQ